MSAPARSTCSFRVRGMCCGDEVAALRREVGPLVGGAERLSFDLLQARMTIRALPAGVGEAEIRRAVARTGMTISAWQPDAPGEERPAARRATLLAAASGLLVIAGYAVQALSAGGPLAGLTAAAPPLAVALFLAAIVAGAGPFLPPALRAARRLRPDMNLLMTLAITGAAGLGQWLEGASVAFLFAVALLLEGWSVGRARRAIRGLLDLAPSVARVVVGGSDRPVERPVAEVPVGARVRVRAGERVPLDGVLTEGRTAVDQAPITGESIPVAKEVGDEVLAGTVNGDGAFEMSVLRPAADTMLSRILRQVEEAQGRRAPVERAVERFARVYTPMMLGLAVALAVLPPLAAGGGWASWLYRALVLLVIACPCALVISTPVAIVAGLTSAARSGVLVKGGGYLEALTRVRAVAFDKTGTLTRGRPEVRQVVPLAGCDETQLLARAAALEAESAHPLARAVLELAASRRVAIEPARQLTALPGLGAEGRIDGRPFWIGGHRLLRERCGDEAAAALADELADAGHTTLAVGSGGGICGLISAVDGPRQEARSTVAALRRSGVERIVVLTGDNERTARAVAEQVGADEVRADLLPGDKMEAVAKLAESGPVAMVGDGINDAPALASATVGIAAGAAATDAALETADVALLGDDLGRLPWLFDHSRRTRGVIRQNVVFALVVKAVFLGLAALDVATLWMAIAADMGASLLVIANALRLLEGKARRRPSRTAAQPLEGKEPPAGEEPWPAMSAHGGEPDAGRRGAR